MTKRLRDGGLGTDRRGMLALIGWLIAILVGVPILVGLFVGIWVGRKT